MFGWMEQMTVAQPPVCPLLLIDVQGLMQFPHLFFVRI